MSELVRIKGTVIVKERDGRGRIRMCGLRTRDGAEYPVLDTPMAEFLRDFLDEVVVVTASLATRDGEVAGLKVLAFEPLEDEAWVPIPQSIEMEAVEEDGM
jgi:hypothetical protein